MCYLLPLVLWQHGLGKKRNDSYFLSLPVERRWHLAVRAAAGWPPLMALGVLLLIVALVGTGVDGIPAQGWVAPLLGATTLYLVSAGLSVRTRHATFIIWILLFLPFEAMRHGPEAERKVLPLLESALVVFMGSDVRVGSGEGPQLIGAVGVSTWLLTSGIALLLGFVVFLLLIVTAEQEKWA